MKKLVCFVLALVILMAFAVPAFADPQKMGDSDVTWELTENDTVLIIGGEGDMPEISCPWWGAEDTITTIIINYGVTSFRSCAFNDSKNLTSVTIPSSVTSISDSAFENCPNLTSVTIPSSVTYIGTSAFAHCTSLTSVTIPSSITYIGNNALAHCDNLSSVTVKATTPPTLENASIFEGDDRLTIYVPYNKSEAYEKVGDWNLYKIIKKIMFEAYMVDVLYAENGTVTVDKDCFPTSDYTETNETVNITATPNEGYYLKSLVWNDGTDHTFGEDEATSFTMPLNNVTVKAVFEEIEEGTGSTLSEGSDKTAAIIGGSTVIAIAAVVIAKKKKAKN